MRPNLGKWDRLVRLFVGVVVLALGYQNQSLWGLLGLIPILTAVVSWCPLYLPFHFNSQKK